MLAANKSRTRVAKTQGQEEHTGVTRVVKMSVKMDTRNYINSLAEEVEQAAGS